MGSAAESRHHKRQQGWVWEAVPLSSERGVWAVPLPKNFLRHFVWNNAFWCTFDIGIGLISYSQFCTPFQNKSCLWWQLSAEMVVNFRRPIIDGSYRRLEWQDVKTFLENFLCFLAKRPLTVEFAKFCSERFHRDTELRLVCKFPEIWPTGNRDIVRCLPGKKNKISP